MASYSNAYSLSTGSIADPEWNRLHSLLEQDMDNFENWESLIRATEALEGGIGRSSSSETVEQIRILFDAFLRKFPLLFGYWKRYADIEFSIAGSDAAEIIYLHGIAGIPNSVDLWTGYCSFKMDTCPDEDEVRDLFDTAAEFVGNDFLSHTLWDKYIEFEERFERPDMVMQVLERVTRIPMHQYARYFERYTQLGATRPVEELTSQEEFDRVSSSLKMEQAQKAEKMSAAEIDRELRIRIHKLHVTRFTEVQQQTMRRWPFEAEIKRPYFHVKPLDETELINWRKYLDFEEIEGDFNRIRFLYEKCLVATAFYDEFWFRYVRWLSGQDGDHTEDIRNIYRRGSGIFVPIGRPAFRIAYAHFEEAEGDYDLARDIFQSILTELPGNIETIIARASLERRVAGVSSAIEVYTMAIESGSCDVYTRGALIAEWARLLWTVKGSPDDARALFEKYADHYLDSRYFWINFLQFEIGLPSSLETEAERYKYISKVHNDIRTKTRLPPLVIKDLSHTYMVYLLERGGPGAIKEYSELDVEVNGPFSMQREHKRKLSEDGSEETTNKRLKKTNGQQVEELEESRHFAMDIPAAD
ncbi:hypothetical protein POJ06DRAFT_254592 [Lipomyces tetrasporus]|uniref:Pre-mRNA-processing factor 39 n=1 Tax=Lipomyces tetrasporus TaxID=54092 RepID=A0AAD7QR28_9ASCO|nr:uncharacterized protein POJ06DRAFT_254592 [Lipomyces tetrasporus]KAJ8099830.1 hypothetical protein POJ06DRAFT_254592 [Lipomyces tetrasporus]